jgi:hypothetical protein
LVKELEDTRGLLIEDRESQPPKDNVEGWQARLTVTIWYEL